MKQPTIYTRRNKPRFNPEAFFNRPIWADKDFIYFFLNRPAEEITIDELFRVMTDRRAPIYVQGLFWNILNFQNPFCYVIYFPSQEIKFLWMDVSDRIGQKTFQPGLSVNLPLLAKPSTLLKRVKKVGS